jgi:hypothetical protein
MEVSGRPYVPPPLELRRKSLWFWLSRGLGGPGSLSGRLEETNVFHYNETNLMPLSFNFIEN